MRANAGKEQGETEAIGKEVADKCIRCEASSDDFDVKKCENCQNDDLWRMVCNTFYECRTCLKDFCESCYSSHNQCQWAPAAMAAAAAIAINGMRVNSDALTDHPTGTFATRGISSSCCDSGGNVTSHDTPSLAKRFKTNSWRFCRDEADTSFSVQAWDSFSNCDFNHASLTHDQMISIDNKRSEALERREKRRRQKADNDRNDEHLSGENNGEQCKKQDRQCYAGKRG